MEIWERVEAALTPLNVPMAQNIYLVAGTDYPDQYLKYQVIVDTAENHADNVEKNILYLVQISIFDKTGLSSLPNIAGAMKTAGFTRGPQRELAYSEVTGHFGLALDFYYLEDV